ncbi:MAG: glycosyltransferase family 2 protein, partial [Armatimonadetes bacterium]|nr:glycosyltransferase family 2 protein [Armatimonadota bacterium]
PERGSGARGGSASSGQNPGLMISVVIPFFNRIELTRRAVGSVLHQAGADFELIVVDDGSTEDPGPIRELVEQARQGYLRTPNRGPGPARNAGARNASGRLLAFLDSDDLWMPGKLERQLACMRAQPRLRLCQCREIWFRGERRVNPPSRHEMSEGDLFGRSCQAVCISSSSVVLDAELFGEMGGFDEKLLVCEDYDLWLRVCRAHRVGLVPERLVVKHGGHEDQMSRRYPAMDRFRLYALVKLLLQADLTVEQRERALESAVEKARILAAGAAGKGRPSAAAYRQFEAWLRESGPDPARVLEALAERLGAEP